MQDECINLVLRVDHVRQPGPALSISFSVTDSTIVITRYQIEMGKFNQVLTDWPM